MIELEAGDDKLSVSNDQLKNIKTSMVTGSSSGVNDFVSKISRRAGNDSGNDDDDVKGSKNNLSLVKLFVLAKPEWGFLFISFLFQVAGEAISLYIPLMLAEVYDTIIDTAASTSDKMSEVNRAMIPVLVLCVVGAFAGFFGGSIMIVAGERVVTRLRNALYRSMLSQEISFFDNTQSGELVSRLGSDTALLQTATSKSLSGATIAFIRICVSLSLMFWISPKLAGLTIGMTVSIFIPSIPFGKFLGSLSKRYQDLLGKAQTRSTEALGSMRTVQSFAAEDREAARYEDIVGDPDSFKYWKPDNKNTIYRIGFWRSVVQSGFVTFIFGAGFVALYGILWYGFKLVLDGEITIGDLTAFNAYIIQIGLGLGEVSSNLAEVMHAQGACGRVFELLERIPAIPSLLKNEKNISVKRMETDIENFDTAPEHTKLIKPQSMEGTVCFENVSFAYQSRMDIPVLRNFTLTIPANTTAAFVGSSGGGKTTIVSLLQRFYDVDQGQIMIDGRDIRSLDLKWMRQHIGCVHQEPQLFGLTVRENICFGLGRDVTDQEVEKACKEANAHDFIMKMPQGYSTLVGERGIKLSGGQKQRVAIARALVINPRILLLDEATSALDAESEHLVQEAINKAVVGRTVLVVAHRLSTIKQSQQIVVLDNHEIIDRGTHDELIGRCAKYMNLIKRQTTVYRGKEE
eukprot:CAMPEP_0197825950 /NCGR_PEP_ID=MMETSP1437-20131217/2972_1 /TAXON_ID=49252 ORGANISM="Eucampia antarctica, Strain CCMP1452" /NCGR_SAMPLE_ID=MMETSP1437 /ASSEMBLY_ACC=CAM_ASM_001096 /LENGTH=686 /DNA_ID=CAMNT_0043426179 /DNA_START=390 /DNA_END=2450 /DNA_ORIENTATION=-